MKVFLLAFIPIALSSACSAQAVSAPSATTTIATISFNTAVLQTAEAQRELATLQTKFAPRQAHLEALNAEIEGLQKQASNDTTKVSIINAKEKQLQREADDFRTEF